MNNRYRFFSAALLLCCAVVVRARADDWRHDDRRRDDHHEARARVEKPSRRPAPKPHPAYHSRDFHVRPAGQYHPPVVRYDRPGYVRPAGWHAPAHNPVLAAVGIAAALVSRERVEITIGNTYWHTDHGMRYAHYYDGHVHWYGFYDGPRFYWTRYEDNRWWWYDAAAARWLYWYDGYWWWHDPAHPEAPYVVINDNYYPYATIAADPALAPSPVPAPQASDAPIAPADSATPPSAPATPAPAAGAKGELTYVSPDSTREVKIYGSRHEAYLFDRTGGGDPTFIAFLGNGVSRAQFSEPRGGGQDQILLLMNDGSFDLFDENGHSLTSGGAPPASGASAAPSAPPADDSLPTAPPSSGQ